MKYALMRSLIDSMSSADYYRFRYETMFQYVKR